MKINFVQVQNFKSFAGAEYDFSLLSDGLYFVTGENQVEPELGANGAGKSALFEAICWCLYGKTSTNLKASNIVKWGEKGGAVEIRFDSFTVTRGQNPNYLHLDHEPVTQDFLEAKLGFVGFESFLYSTFISQFSSKFFDLAPADKMIVFSDIMSELLFPWTERSDKAKIKSDEYKANYDGLQNKYSHMEGKLEELKDLSYKDQMQEFDFQKKLSIKAVKDEHGKAFSDLIDAKNILVKIKNERTDTENAIANFKMPTERTMKQLAEHKATFAQAISDRKADITAINRAIKEMEDVSGKSVCPTCKRKVDASVLKKEIKKYQEEIVGLSEELERFEDRYKQAVDILDVHAEEEKLFIELKASLRHYEMEIDSKTMIKKRIEREVQKLEQKLQEEKERKNIYIELEKERQARMRGLEADLKLAKSVMDSVYSDYKAYSYWIKGFKEIRLLMMYDALKEFEISINNNLSKFGMGDWNVKLDIDQENKSGTIRKGFAVLVESPDHAGFVPFEVWSGGEGQRLRLAGTIGLMDLIQSKRGMGFGLEIFDEPTAWLSEKGIDDLLQILYYRAKENSIKIFMIDHKNLQNFGGFHDVIKITKTREGSVIC